LRELVQTRSPQVALQAVHIDVNENDADSLRALWLREHIEAMGVPLMVLASEYGGGNIVDGLQQYITSLLEKDASLHAELVIPEWTPGSGWAAWLAARFLHHLTGARLKLAFLSEERVTVTNHRYVVHGSSDVSSRFEPATMRSPAG
jgi:hypothetical protein